MQGGQAADLAIFCCCAALLVGYNVFYFTVSSFTLPLVKRRYMVLYAVNRQSRASWVRQLSQDQKEGINAVQTIRNQVLAVSILAASTAPMTATLVNVITDTAKLDQVAAFSATDPISSVPLFSPQVKLGVAFGLLLLSVMAYAQSVRLSVHVGYTMRVVAADPVRHAGLSHLSVTLMRRSSLYFAVGLRLFFMWGPVVLWVLGPTALLISTLLDVVAQCLFDVVPASHCEQGGPQDGPDEGEGEGEGGGGGGGGPPPDSAALLDGNKPKPDPLVVI